MVFFKSAVVVTVLSFVLAAPVFEQRALPTPVSVATAKTYLAACTFLLIERRPSSKSDGLCATLSSDRCSGIQFPCVLSGLLQPLDH